jgi:hypothetical protein
LVNEVGFNNRIPIVERELLQLRLRQQKLLGHDIDKEQDVKNIIRDIQIRFKDNKDANVQLHNFSEIYDLIDKMAEKLYLYISRDEI